MKVLAHWRKAIPTAVAAGLLCLAFPPVNLYLVVLICLAPWLAALRDTDGKGACKSGYLFGVIYFGFQMFWLVPFVSNWTGSYLLAAIPWIAAALIAGLYYLFAGWLIHRCWVTRRIWMIPLVWAGVEGIRAYIYLLAFPWGFLALPLWRMPWMVQHAAFGTILLVSAWLIIPNLLLAIFVWPAKGENVDNMPHGRSVVRLGLVFLGLLVLSAYRFSTEPAGVKKTITIGQTGVDMAFGDPLTKQDDLEIAVTSILGTAAFNSSDFVVLPEGIAGESVGLPPNGPVGSEPPLPVLFGGNRVDGDDTFQTAYAWDGEWSSVDKTRLVIFGEYVPFRKHLPFLQAFDLPSGDLTPGDEIGQVKVSDITVAPLVCFEGVFPDIVDRHTSDGAQLLAVMAIDDWYAGTMAQEQLWMSSVWRSIESGLPLVRSASLGQSLATDSRGRLLTRAPYGETTPLRVELNIPDQSDAGRPRMLFVWLSWLAVTAVVLEALWRKKKSGQETN